MDKKYIDEYGKDSFFDILKYFCGAERTNKLIDLREKKDILQQFKSAKKSLHGLVNQPDMQAITMQNAWWWIKISDGHIIPDILHLIYIYILIPLQTAVVERGFSVHRRIKTRLSSCLQVVTVDSLLRVKLNADPNPRAFDMAAAEEAYMARSKDGKPPTLIARIAKGVNDIEIGDLQVGVVCSEDKDEEPFGPGSSKRRWRSLLPRERGPRRMSHLRGRMTCH